MEKEITACPNCNTLIKNNFLTSIKILSEDKTKLINHYNNDKHEAYCSKCGLELYDHYVGKLNMEKLKLANQINELIDAIPVLSLQNPAGWDYMAIAMITGQSTTGTGAITEFTSSFTDLFGGQSGRHNRKLKAGEELCFAQLRVQALELGGNAVIGTDIDYAEVGSEKGMLMVCMGGTAVKLINVNILSEDRQRRLVELVDTYNRMEVLNNFVIV